MEYESDVDLINLQRQLVEHFSLDEIKGLCFDLKIDDEAIAGATKPDKTRELIKFGYRAGRIPDIVQRCAELRPPAEVWNKPAKIYARDGLPDEWIEPLQRLYRLVREFNRNRHLPFGNERTHQGDGSTFTREAAPFLFGQFDVGQWLKSESVGKRLATINTWTGCRIWSL